MDWMTEESIELSRSIEGYAAFLRKNKKQTHEKEMRKFVQKMNYLEFQELIELWARYCSRKKDISISASSEAFYKSREWKRIRYIVLMENPSCSICGWGVSAMKKLHVDHIKSRWLYPDLALDFSNLQTLCEDCNLGKGITGDGAMSSSRPGRILIRRTNCQK